jgi:predicted RNA binding protein YcfA (HicA-like mRNA interferase family)
MGRYEKTVDRLIRGQSDNNFSFRDLCWLLKKLGFEERIKGSHHILSNHQLKLVVNLQPRKSKAKGYQARQVREILTENELLPTDDERMTSTVQDEEPHDVMGNPAEEPEDGNDDSTL